MRGLHKSNRVSHIVIDGSNVADHLTKELGLVLEPAKERTLPSKPSRIYRWWLYMLVLVLCYVGGFLVTLSATYVPETHPNIPDREAKPALPLPVTDTFSVEYAYSHLEFITRQPHQFNMPYNEQVEQYIRKFAEQLQGEYSHVELDHVERDVTFTGTSTNSSQFGIGNSTGYFEASNVVVRVRGTQSQNSLLISAHFDSVPLSYGANDNGMGVATALEVLRLLALHPPTNDVIFNINNHEETGLLGSYSFTRHPWFPNVKAFINIDGAGAGGRVLLFQCSSLELVSLAKSIPHPNTSVLGNDLFQLKVLNSVTDFAVYSTANRMPGVDFAIYKNRAFYHTALDNLEHAYVPTLANMGQSIWPLTIAILSSSYLDSNPQIQVAGVFYDLLGLFSINYQFQTDWIMGLTLNILMILGGISYFFYLRHRRLLPPSLRVILLPTSRGFVAILVGMLLYLSLCHLSNYTIQKLNLLIIHDQWAVVYFFNAGLALLSFMIVDFMWLQLELRYRTCLVLTRQQHHRRFQVVLISMGYMWFFGLILQRIVTSMVIGIFYYVTWFSASYLISYSSFVVIDPVDYWVSTPLPPRRHRLLKLCFLMVSLVFIPGLILHDAAKNVLISMSQSLVTGTSPYFVYVLASFLSMATTLPIFPFLTLSSNHYRKTIPGLLMILIMLFVAILTVNPLHASAPTTIYATQTYNLTSNQSQVTIRGVSQLRNLASKLSAEVTFTPGTPFDMLQYSGQHPTFPVSKSELMNLSKVNSTQTSKQFQFQAYDTKQCRLRLGINLSNLTISTNNSNYLTLDTKISPPPQATLPATDFYSIILFRRLSSTPWFINFQHSPTPQQIPLQVTCFYDDYPQYIPIINQIQSNLPNYVTLSTGAHILEVYQELLL